MKVSTPDHRLHVVFLDPDPVRTAADWPFACVVSASPEELIYDTTKPCLHVLSAVDGVFEFCDGLYAVHKRTTIIGGPIDWPVLVEALVMPVKAYSKSLMPKQGELPFQRVMIWGEYGHMNPPLADDAEGHAALALRAAQKWNGWMEEAEAATKNKRAKKWGFDDALRSVCSEAEWEKIEVAGRQFKEGDAFRKFLEEIGLHKPHLTDFATPYGQLIGVLRDTFEVHQGVSDRLRKGM